MLHIPPSFDSGMNAWVPLYLKEFILISKFFILQYLSVKKKKGKELQTHMYLETECKTLMGNPEKSALDLPMAGLQS